MNRPRTSSHIRSRAIDGVLTPLFEGLVDYAGLFPPAKLDMGPAVEEYARQRTSEQRWMLARFIVPVSRLDELVTAAAPHTSTEPWPLSVLAPGDPQGARQAIDSFLERHGTRLRVEAIEHRPSAPGAIGPAAEVFSGFEVFFELPYGEGLEPWMAAVAAAGGRAKIRSGGVTADAFPSSAELARFLAVARCHGVALKATAGLHHPLRGEYRLTYENNSPRGLMHGFLNLFLAAAGLWGGLFDEAQVRDVLEERSAEVFEVGAEGIRWRGLLLDRAVLEAGRQSFALSYGSCSFAEPVEDLRRLGLLP